MSLSEKFAYIQGLIDGGEIKFEGKNQKLFDALMEVLGEIVTKVSCLDENLSELYESLYLISDRLKEIDENVDSLFDNDLNDIDYSADFEENEIFCENCKKTVPVDSYVAFIGETYCPECNKKIDIEECELSMESCETK